MVSVEEGKLLEKYLHQHGNFIMMQPRRLYINIPFAF